MAGLSMRQALKNFMKVSISLKINEIFQMKLLAKQGPLSRRHPVQMLEVPANTLLPAQGEALSVESVPHKARMSSVAFHVSFNNLG